MLRACHESPEHVAEPTMSTDISCQESPTGGDLEGDAATEGPAADDLGQAVHVWFCRTERLTDEHILDRCAQVLSEVETERWQRYLRPRDRRLFLVAHGLLRFTLSRYAEVPPEDWQYDIGTHGRPRIAAPDGHVELRFNLSHSQGLAAVQVNLGMDCGVDVEGIGRDVDMDGLARACFSPAERADLLALPRAKRRRRFFEYWTLKESYIKARGLGLAIPLQGFAMHVANPVTVAFEPELQDEPKRWQFHLARPTDEHQMAVAIPRGLAQDVPVVIRETRLQSLDRRQTAR